jgi:hypothetical protein
LENFAGRPDYSIKRTAFGSHSCQALAVTRPGQCAPVVPLPCLRTAIPQSDYWRTA